MLLEFGRRRSERVVRSYPVKFSTRTVKHRVDSLNAMPNKPVSDSVEPNPTNWLDCADDYARREPVKAVVSAFGAGFLVNLLPIGAVVGALTGIAFLVLRPVLLFLGLMKACELWRPRS